MQFRSKSINQQGPRRVLLLPVLLLAFLLPGRICPAQPLDTFYNNTTYTSGANIDATNFINDYGGTFSVPFPAGNGWLSDLYQQWYDTYNFTNNGEMDCATGFRFDSNLNPGGIMAAANFYNAGNINCGTSSNAIFLVNGNLLVTAGYGGLDVWATNVFNSGTINIGPDGLGEMSGNNINFTLGTLAMDNAFLDSVAQTNTVNLSAVDAAAINTNAWYPDIELGPTAALSSPFLDFYLPNSTPYFSVVSDATGTNFVVRMVFIENVNTNVPVSVYFGSQFGNGYTTVGWTGSYTDPVTGNSENNYLYLTDDYVGGSLTNILVYNGSTTIPQNFGIYEQTNPLSLGAPTASSYPDYGFNNGGPFPSGYLVTTNVYVDMDVSLIASTISTNAVPNGSITNLPGRFLMIASNELNFQQASIYGMNYLLLQSTNNFDNDGASSISSPYTDVYLGRTNNSMVVSNLLLNTIPFWNGTLQAWNSRWHYTDTNRGYNFDYRILMVQSDVEPTTSSQQRNVALYSTNNLVVSDTLNIFGTFYANCTNMLLTYNGDGAGVGSVDGELDLSSPGVFWASATPRLNTLTNNGAIRTATQANFGSASAPYLNFVNSGTVSNLGTIIYANTFSNSGAFYEYGGSFESHCSNAVFSAGLLASSGSVSNACYSLSISNITLTAPKWLSLTVTNLLTDGGMTSNIWSLGTGNGGLGIGYGLTLPVKPTYGDLLGTTVTNFATSGTVVNELWAGQDRGTTIAGFTNNVAIGQMIFDAMGSNTKTNYYFRGSSISNAMYIDCIVLEDSATNTDLTGNYSAFGFNTNLVIYYAQALANNVSIAGKMNHQNGDHFRWVADYTGFFSSTNIEGNVENAALATSSDIDSDGDGLVNSVDPTPFFVSQMIDFTINLTNLPPKAVQLTWQTPPLATNYVYYSTNLLQPWMPFNSFVNYYWNNGVAVTNSAHTNWFISPQAYDNPATNVWIFDAITNMPHFYRVVVQPNLLYTP